MYILPINVLLILIISPVDAAVTQLSILTGFALLCFAFSSFFVPHAFAIVVMLLMLVHTDFENQHQLKFQSLIADFDGFDFQLT